MAAVAASLFLAAGVTAQDLTFTTTGGQALSLSSMRGRVIVLFFSGVQDPQCRDGLKTLHALAERYEHKDVAIYWVSVNGPNEMSNEQLKAPCGSTEVQTLRDAGGSALKRFSGKSAQLPTVVVLDRQGNASGSPRGGFNPNSDFVNDLSSTIDGLLKR